jgi:hypothetical protein
VGGIAVKAIVGIVSALFQSSEGSDSSSSRVEMNIIIKEFFCSE